MKHIHILGICGTFMGSLARLAKEKGFRVTGSDLNVYPPMSTQLEAAGIELVEGWGVDQLALKPDQIIVGNVISRGNPVMEAVLNRGLPYTSGPQWFAENILQDRWVLAAAGTHGKTTTASMLAWILEYAGFQPGFLIGGVPNNFSVSSALGRSDFFVVEADEYDSAFFDKRSKFVHYRPRTLILNNLEFDHADIFPNLQAIQTQFHHLVRTVPEIGQIIYPADCENLKQVLEAGCWSSTQTLGADWQVQLSQADASEFEVLMQNQNVGRVGWNLTGDHNASNALASIAAARHVGIDPELSCRALCEFSSVKRRMELKGKVQGTSVYDDFAHHPTAIKTTLKGLRAKVGQESILAIIEPRSNTMKAGIHKQDLMPACGYADAVFWMESKDQAWSLKTAQNPTQTEHQIFYSVEDIVAAVSSLPSLPQHIVIMSNGGFGGIHDKLLKALEQHHV